MQITRQTVADQLSAYLHHRMSLEELVDWAEQQVMEGEFESTTVRDAVARLGVADVRAFGLTWEDCQRLLNDLGFAAQVNIGTA
jgi:cobyrinic acid a,c-diamide synthase